MLPGPTMDTFEGQVQCRPDKLTHSSQQAMDCGAKYIVVADAYSCELDSNYVHF